MTRAPRDKQKPAPGVKLSQYTRPGAVLDLVVDTKDDLLRSLAEVVLPEASEEIVSRIFDETRVREASVNTYVGNGVAIPHARVDFVDGFALAIARNAAGFPYGIDTEEPVVLVVLVVGNEQLQNEHVSLLGQIATLLNERERRDSILAAADPAAVIRLLDSGPGPRSKARPLTQLLMSHAQKIAREMGVTSILVTIENQAELVALKRLPRRKKFIVATRSAKIAENAEKVVERVLRLPRLASTATSTVRLAALMALTHGLIQKGELVAFLSGSDGPGIDSMTMVEVGKQFGRFVTASGELSSGISAEVLERVITLASALGAEGREGKPVGTLFVLVGRDDLIQPYVQQMVMNPFRGYPEEERNVLDPTLAETIKEFAMIDGGFVVRGDGVVLSAGTFLKVDEDVDLPGGFGSRHRASAAITKMIDCIAITLSQSSGEVRIYNGGAEVLMLQRGSSLSGA